MTFPRPTNPNEWQSAYSRDDAFRDSGKWNSISSLAFLAGVLLIAGYIAVRVIPKLNLQINLASPRLFLVMVLSVILVGFLILLFVFLILSAIQTAATFFARWFLSEFYLPPTDVDPNKIINYRLFGKSKLPPPLNMFLKFNSITFKNGQMEKGEEWAKWSALHIGGPIALTIHDGCALYLERGNRFSRVVGSGNKIPFLEWFETIKYIVDLRPKAKEGTFEVWTKDGIKIKVTARIVCRVGDPANNTDPDLMYPFDPLAVKKAVECLALRWSSLQKDPEEFDWIDTTWGQVTGIMPRYIGSRMLDDLLIAERKSGQILSPEAVKELINELNQATNQFGVYVLDFQIQQIETPAKVIEQQKEYWKAERQGMVTVIDGKAKASSIRSRERARAEAQKDLILAIADGLDKNQYGNFTEPLLLSLSRVLDESLQDPYIRATIAGETLDTLEKVQKLLDQPVESSDKNAKRRTGTNS
jgi:regulator of protease activity HflC (stomatin/prohibitin superfamily)